jgi:hypothetical protein
VAAGAAAAGTVAAVSEAASKTGRARAHQAVPERRTGMEERLSHDSGSGIGVAEMTALSGAAGALILACRNMYSPDIEVGNG